METLQYLRDVANGKRHRFFNVSPKAVDLFKRWIADWHAAATLEEVFDQWEMGAALDDRLHVRLLCKGKRGVVEFAHPHSPLDRNKNTSEPYVNDELLYLVLKLVTTPSCERLRLCPECEKHYIAIRPQQKYCGSKCGRLAASRRVVGKNYEDKWDRRIKACRAAYAKYRTLKPKPREAVEEYVLHEANRLLPKAHKEDDKMGGPKMQVNFITKNAKAIGIPKGEK